MMCEYFSPPSLPFSQFGFFRRKKGVSLTETEGGEFDVSPTKVEEVQKPEPEEATNL